MIWVTIIGLIILSFIIIGAISEFKERRKQRLRDKAAKEVLENFNIEKEKEKIEKIINEFGEEIYVCPGCNKGYMIKRNGKYGEFLGCSEYPKCRYTENI